MRPWNERSQKYLKPAKVAEPAKKDVRHKAVEAETPKKEEKDEKK